MVADSRQVALNHTAGLSLPQQVQMTLFAVFSLVDADQSYKIRTRAIVNRRLANLYEGMELALPADPLRAGYYAEIDLMRWARRRYGHAFADWLADDVRARRSRVPARGRPRRGAPERRRFCRYRVVGPGLVGQPARR